MFPSHAAEVSAVAFQLIARLEAYEQDLERVPAQRADPELLSRLASHFDEMQLEAALLPPLSVSWVALLISRAELMHRVWAAQREPRPGIDTELQELMEQHREALHALRLRATRLIRRS